MKDYWTVLAFSAMLSFACIDYASLGGEQLDKKEYCEDEFFFKPKCEDNKVIVIQYARYGRMHTGRCIPDSKDLIGCSMDAKDILSSKCSGLRSCEVMIATIPLMHNYPCDRQMRGYLEVAFKCTDVIYPPRGYCRTGEVTEIREDSGYVSSVVTEETGCGASLSPWMFSVKEGRQLRFHLHVYSSEISDRHPRVQVYAVLDEETAGTSQPLTNKVPELTTAGNRVKLTIMSGGMEGQTMDNFLIRFEATGCATTTPPDNGWSRRVGEEMHMGCNITHSHELKAEWTMRCVDDKWSGHMQTCAAVQRGNPSPNAAAAKDGPEWSIFTESNALFITVGLGLAILIGLCLLVIGLLYICRMKRRQRCPPERPVNSRPHNRLKTEECLGPKGPFLPDPEAGDDYYCPAQIGHKHQRQGQRGGYHPKHGQSPSELPPPPPPYSPARPLSSVSTNRWSCTTGAEHVYERPTFSIPPSDHAAEGDTHSMSTSYNPADQPCPECDHMNTL